MQHSISRLCLTVTRATLDRARGGSFALLLILALMTFLTSSVYAADGDLDTTFPNPGLNLNVRAMTLQPDGKILIGGDFTWVWGTTMNRVARLNTDGTLDTSFGDPNVSGGQVRALVRQSDGKVLIGGEFTSVAWATMNRVARLNSDGTRDTSFNDPNVSSLFSTSVYELALQSDGKILVGGSFMSVGGQSRTGLARLNSDGTLDTAFDANLDLSLIH
ncbi:MAG: delta-60 repeat domain-containing protein, partial [Anaerolineae bacterium]|nr:delta-60 repeat domain-containing protein [Anaerolineae bacterium]